MGGLGEWKWPGDVKSREACGSTQVPPVHLLPGAPYIPRHLILRRWIRQSFPDYKWQ